MRKFKDAFKLFCTDWCDSRNLLITAFIAVLLGILATAVVAICNVCHSRHRQRQPPLSHHAYHAPP